MSWIKVGGGELTNKSELVFTNISRGEAGEYRCEARNLSGNDSESVSVDVQCKYYIQSETLTEGGSESVSQSVS